jgi:uncharacterized protein DUF3303
MKQFLLTRYTYKKHLDEVEIREMVKKFAEVGSGQRVLANYVALDGSGGYIISEALDLSPEEVAKEYETTIAYAPYMDFEMTPVTTIDDAVPSIFKVYG